jgi:MFS family permease
VSDKQAIPPPLRRNLDFGLLTGSAIVSTVGTKMSKLALPLLALGLTGSPAVAGLLAAAEQLPYLLFSLPAGAWIDRADRKLVMIGCDLLRFALLISIPIAYALQVLTIAQLFVVAFVQGICTVFFAVAELAALPSIVARPQLAQARAVSQGVESAAEVVGPSLGGFIIGLGRTDVAGATLAYLVDAISYLISGGALLGIRRRLQPAQRPAGGSLLADMRDGLAFLWRTASLRFLMLLTASINFLQGPLYLLTVLVAQQRFGFSPAQLGLFFGLVGGAAVLGAALAPSIYARASLRTILAGSIAVWGAAAVGMAVANNPIMLLLSWICMSFCWPLYDVAVVTHRLEETPDHLHGRVISAFRTVSYGAEPLGVALGGLLVAGVGAGPLLGAIGALLGCCLIWALRRST